MAEARQKTVDEGVNKKVREREMAEMGRKRPVRREAVEEMSK